MPSVTRSVDSSGYNYIVTRLIEDSMAEALGNKKKMCRVQRASATRMINRVGKTIAALRMIPRWNWT